MLCTLLFWLPLVTSTMAGSKFRGDIDISEIDTLQDRIQHLEQNLQLVSRQLMMQQYYVEEQVRNAGNSGLKRMRVGQQGTRPYHSASHVDSHMLAAIHNHPNYERLLGFGEMAAVLNGVEFRTRHNDYMIKMRRQTGNRLIDIPFPEVPPEVTQYDNITDQINEMRRWFKAWSDQDYSVRDYRPYFKPVLCYLEGSWTDSSQSSIDEPFESDRHHLDATSWLDLTEKIRFTSYSGSKDSFENLAYLPTTIIRMLNGTDPVLAQWNFAILCHPLKTDLPLNRLQLVDDLKTRMSMGGATLEHYEASRTARFQVATYDKDKFSDGKTRWSLLDRLMEEVPGRDGYGGFINDTLFDDVVYQYKNHKKSAPLNAAYYHRWYQVASKGALGRETRHRGFSDENMFVAQTTDPKVAGLKLEKCKKSECSTWSQKWTYAIPLEIVYMNPLSKWNPYSVPHRGNAKSAEGRTVYEGPNGHRNGKGTPDKAYNGTNTHKYFITPTEFFLDPEDVDPADTIERGTYVLDNNGTMHGVKSSGFWIHIPDIPGVGRLRQRYPIMPLHEEGSGVWKELAALTDIVLHPTKYKQMFREDITQQCTEACRMERVVPTEQNIPPVDIPVLTTSQPQTPVMSETVPVHTTDQQTQLPSQACCDQQFVTQEASSEWGHHEHYITVSQHQMQQLQESRMISVTTDEAHGHSHRMTLYKLGTKYLMGHCDCDIQCLDGHGRRVFLVPVNTT